MGLWRLLFGRRQRPTQPRAAPKLARIREELPRNRSRIQQGFWWNTPPLIALAAGKGFNQEVVGESFRQEHLVNIVGGRGQYGCTFHTTAQLALPSDLPDHPNAVAVLIETKHVGFIPEAEAEAIRSELLALPGTGGGVTCKAVIRGGWDQTANGGDRGHFGVCLSLARPLRTRLS